MVKILLIQDVISNYRVPVYNIIAKQFDLTVLYSNGKVPDGIEFDTIYAETYKKGPFTIFRKNLSNILKGFDVIIFPYDPMQVSILFAMFKAKIVKKQKFISWGIGVPASYNVKYDSPRKTSKLCYFLAKLCDASVFYSDYPKNKYAAMGVSREKMFVAHNTVEIYPYDEDLSAYTSKDIFLFVGSLYKQKGLGVLLEAYITALRQDSEIPSLYIIGGGTEYDEIASFISENQLEQKVILKGPIYNEQVLSTYFLRARACISPNQAGLSVQKSMGYGVPFVTKKDAITGGEIFDIENNIRGVLYQDDSQLVDILLDINNNPQKYLKMGRNGKMFYRKNRTIQIMAQGVIDAVNYVIGVR